jgi:hypothetical protein
MKTKTLLHVLFYTLTLAALFTSAKDIDPVASTTTNAVPTADTQSTMMIPETVLAQKAEQDNEKENLSVTTNVIARYPRSLNPGHALLRGFVNTLTCWMDVPRELVLQVNKYPFFGLITGTLKGGFFMGSRAVLSATDLLMLGFTGPSLYDPVFFPEYVWNAQWQPYEPPSPEEEYIENQFHEKDAVIENMESAL